MNVLEDRGGLYPERSHLYDQVMRALHFALLLLTLAMLLQLSVGRCDAATAPSVSVVNVPFLGSPMATDAQGNIFFTSGAGPGFPVTPGAAQVQWGGGTCGGGFIIATFPCVDAFVAKIKVSGNTGTVVFATYLGGTTADVGTGIALDANGNIYVTGITSGALPTTPHAFMPAGPGELFAAKLNPQGSQFLYVTYLPGSAAVRPAIAVDPLGNAYVAGQTQSGHAFVAKLSPDGSALLYNTVLGGSDNESGAAISVDQNGNAYITGRATSPDFPVSRGAFQTRLAGGSNAFAAKLDPSGNIVFATYLGGSGYDYGTAIQVDSGGYVHVAGATTSLDFPTTAGSYEPQVLVPMWSDRPSGGFVVKLSPAGDKLAYSSYVFSDNFGVTSMVIDNAGGAYLTGSTSAGVPVTASAPQPCFGGHIDIFVTHLNQNGALVDRTYLGGPDGAAAPTALALLGDSPVLVANLFGQATLAALHFGDANFSPAPCLSSDVLNAAVFLALGPVAPGELISLTGIGLGPESGISYRPAPDGSAPRELAGVRVLFDDLPAPLLYVQSQQINAIVPFELAGRTTTKLRVEYNGASTNTVDTHVGVVSPGIFRLHPGFSTQAAVLNEDGTINGPAHPAKVGSVISLFGTGFGQTNVPGVTGNIFPLEPAPLQMPSHVRAYTDGSPLEVLYAGAAPGLLSGIDQINVRLPMTLSGTGDTVNVFLVTDIANDTVWSGQATIFVGSRSEVR